MWFIAGTLTWYHTHEHTHTQRYTAHSGASRLTHPYKYILTPPVMCSQQLSLLQWMNISPISIYFPQFLFLPKIIHLLKLHICWLDAIRLCSSCETQIIHSVHQNINLPSKTPPPLFQWAPTLKSANCPSPSPLLGKSPIYWFFVNSPPKIWVFWWTPIL